MSRRWLIAVSITAHLCILTGVFVSGIWRLERLEAAPIQHVIHLPPQPPPPPAGGFKAPRLPEITPLVPKRPVHDARQPVTHPETRPVEPTPRGAGDGSSSGSGSEIIGAACIENCGDGPPAAPVCGNGSIEAGEQCDDGNTTSGDGCSATCKTEVKPPPRPRTIEASVLAGLRISGETQVHPDEATQRQMVRDGTSRVMAVVYLCIAPDGSVSSTRLMVPTKYPAYDAALVAAVAGWRYQSYRPDGAPVAACSTVRFVYTMQ